MNTPTSPASLLASFLHAIDVVDWTTVRSCFGDSVRVDYTCLEGGEPSILSGDQLVEKWRALLPGFDATQHLAGAMVSHEEEDSARVDTHVRAYHHLKNASGGGEVWKVAGHYEAELKRDEVDWKIVGLTLRLFYQQGNLELPKLATARAKSSPREFRPGHVLIAGTGLSK